MKSSKSKSLSVLYIGKKRPPVDPESSSDLKGLTNAFSLRYFLYPLVYSYFFSRFVQVKMLQQLLETERESTTNSPSPNKCVCVCIQTQGDHNNILYIPQQRNAYLPLIKSLIKQLNNSPFKKHNDTRTYVLPSDVEQG
jgi:hypothetical protein